MEEDAGAGGLSTLPDVETPMAEGRSEPIGESNGATGEVAAGSGASRATQRWPIVAAAVLFLLAGGAGAGGYLAMQAHQKSEAVNGAHEAALAAAKDCLAATQPPSAAAIPSAQQKLSECSTGNFAEQSTWYGEVLAQAYQAVDVRVQVPEMYAAVERDNEDGSIDALVVFRATVSQTGMADRENGYRVRVKMVPDNGRFRVAELDQVAK